MGMLTRYHKAGGFLQLVQLIEVCGKQKQNNFLSIIEKEDSRWSEVLLLKMLSIEKIFTWDESVLGEIAVRLQQLTLATALQGISEAQGEMFLKTFSHSQRRNITDLKNSKNHSETEVSAAFIKIIQEVRNMISQGYLRVEKFAPELVIEENIEDKILKSFFKKSGAESTVAAGQATAPTTSAISSGNSTKLNDSMPNKVRSDSDKKSPAEKVQSTRLSVAEQIQKSNEKQSANDMSEMHKKVERLILENQALKNEVKALNEKLSLIRKVA
jgi:hypothetical protein